MSSLRNRPEENPPPESYDAWFKQQIEASIEDPRPSVPHQAVMKRTRAIIDRIAEKKLGSED
jgi:hypothetical protein